MKYSRVYRSTDIGSDHYLVCQTVKLRLRNQPKEKKGIRVGYDTTELKNKKYLEDIWHKPEEQIPSQMLEDECQQKSKMKK